MHHTAQPEEVLFTPQDEMAITDIETLRALTDPLRLRILELLAQPQTVKELAPKLAIGKTKLYYHINLLEKHGVIRVVRTRLVSGITEKSYQVTAQRFRPAKELLFGGEEGKARGLAVFDTIWEATRADFARSVKGGQIDSSLQSTGNKLFVGHTVIELTQEQAQGFTARLDALLEELKGYEAPAANACSYALTIAFFPKADE